MFSCLVPVYVRAVAQDADDSYEAWRRKGVSIKAFGLYKPTSLRRQASAQIDSQGNDSDRYGGKPRTDPAAGGLQDEGLDLDNPVSLKSNANRPRPPHTKKEINVQTQTNRATTAPMVRCHGGARRTRASIDELLADVRVSHPDWFARFEDANLSVVASADLMQVIELISTAPSERLAGLVEGMWINN